MSRFFGQIRQAGYVVNDAPDAGPGTPTHPGAGQDAAVGWLNRLKAVAQRKW